MNQPAHSRRPEHYPAAGRNPRRQGVDPRRHAYGDAVRHSFRVRFLRRVLPSLAIIILALVAAIAWLDPLRLVRDLPLDVLKLSIKDNKLVMDAPKLSGFTKDGRGYNITARAAAQDLSKTNVIELDGITANFTLSSSGQTELTAVKGVYDAKADTVQLTEGVIIKSTSGYEGKLADAYIEVKKGHVVTANPVDIIFNSGTLRADKMEIFDNGARAMFEGGVVMVVKLPPPSTPAATASAEPAR
jgi:lipopolysaccharide export system protein LptC